MEIVLGVADAKEVRSRTPGVELFDAGADNKCDPGVTDGAEEVVGTTRVPSERDVATEGPEAEAKEPVPHGIFSPLGWVGWEGATIFLAESVMAKRPVQVLFVVDWDEN